MRRESPVKRRNPSGMWCLPSRYTGRDGKHHIAKPTWNRGKGTFKRKHEARQAIDEAYGLSDRPDTLGEYAAAWIECHPRSERTNATSDLRVSRVLDVEIEGIVLKDWPMRELRRRHALALVDHMLRVQGRATRRRRHPPLALSNGRGRDHRRSGRPQPLQGSSRPRRRPEGEEKASPDPCLQL